MGETSFTFQRRGRNMRVAFGLACTYAVLAAALALLNAAPWIVAIAVLLTLPALIDLVTDKRAEFTLTGQSILWKTGRRVGEIALSEIGYIRFDTRWDFSHRVTAYLHNGKKVRLPWECLPPHRELESELTDRGLRVERHHFRVF